MHDNIGMVDLDHTHLCNVCHKKVKWHAVKNLGKWKNLDEKELQLLFEPGHRSIDEISIDDDGDFIRSQKKNEHVTWSEKKFLGRH